MKSVFNLFVLLCCSTLITAQIMIPVDPQVEVEASKDGQVAIRGYSGAVGTIVPIPTNPGNIGILGIGYHGIKGIAKGADGAGVYADADIGKYGVHAFSADNNQISVYGSSAGGKGVVGESFQNQGVAGISPFGIGVFGMSGNATAIKATSDGWYGLEVESKAHDGAYIQCANGKANIVLAGSDSPWGGGTDDAVIRTQPGQHGGDLILVTNDVLSIHLDDDNNSSSESFNVYNGSDNAVMSVDQSGNMVVAGSYNISSDVHKKEAFEFVDNKEILEKLNGLNILKWQYKKTPERHIGPMAQDFYKAFGLGKGNTTISTIDGLGISMAAIQELSKVMQEQSDQLANQQKLIIHLRSEIDSLKKRKDD